MGEDDFQWDDAKAADNILRHGVSFALARAAFGDPFGVEWADERRSIETSGGRRFDGASLIA